MRVLLSYFLAFLGVCFIEPTFFGDPLNNSSLPIRTKRAILVISISLARESSQLLQSLRTGKLPVSKLVSSTTKIAFSVPFKAAAVDADRIWGRVPPRVFDAG